MPVPESLAPRAPGQLIRSDDWNALVAGVNQIEAALATRVAAVEATVAALLARVTDAEAGLAEVRTDVATLYEVSYRVTLATTKTNFALGELAEITATLRDLRGAVPAPVNGERPWIDFVTSWGQLKAVSGFAARAGVAERTISVQTDAEGVARVRLAADIVEDMTEDTEVEFGSFLNTVVAGNQTFANIVLASNTPSDAPVMQAYGAVKASYDGVAGGAVRNYVDSYYVKNAPKLSGKLVPGFTNQRRERWRDYHITVLAFGKADSDPRTPDAGRGLNSIQLTFRDWIGPWIIVDYLPTFTAEIPNLINVLRPAITTNFRESADLIKNAVGQQVQDRGLLGKARAYEAVRGALDAVSPVQPVPFLADLKQSMKSAISLQQNLQFAQTATPLGGTGEVALEAFTDTAVRANAGVAGVEARVQQVSTSVTSVQQSVGALGGRLDATVAEGGQLQQLRADLSTVNSQVQGLRVLGDPSAVSERLNLISLINARLDRIENR